MRRLGPATACFPGGGGPTGVDEGQHIRVKGWGVPAPKGAGDLLVSVEVAVPSKLSSAERKGLVGPARTGGGSRPYSDADITQLRRIQELTAEGGRADGASVP